MVKISIKYKGGFIVFKMQKLDAIKTNWYEYIYQKHGVIVQDIKVLTKLH